MAESQIQFVGGRLCLDFLNTQTRKQNQEIDLLTDSDHLLSWLRSANVLAEEEADLLREQWSQKEDEEQALQKALALRTAFRCVVESVREEQPAPSAALAEMNALLAETLTHSQVHQQGMKFTRSENTTPPATRWLVVIVQDAIDLLCNADLSLLKQCDGPTCIRFFYDTTKNHKRRWCSVEKCGSRAKAAAYYHRIREVG